jgi:antitoxin HicB
MKYPAEIKVSGHGRYIVTFRDIPEANTQADTEAEALAMAADALLTSIDFYFEDNRPVPAPSKARPGEHLVTLPLSVSAKVLLLNRMLKNEVRPADLARLMGVMPQEVTRLMNLKHNTKIDTVAQAISAMGFELQLLEVDKDHAHEQFVVVGNRKTAHRNVMP